MTTLGRTGAIIAGGRAARLGGRDKTQLVVGGRSIVARQVGLLRDMTDEVIIVGDHPGRVPVEGTRSCPDIIEGVGPIGGLYSALEAASTERVLVIACDLPFLERPLLERLAELAESAEAAWVRTPDGVEPLVACYRKAVRHQVRAAIGDGRLKLARLSEVIDIAELGASELARFGDPARLLMNVNTPGDYQRVQ